MRIAAILSLMKAIVMLPDDCYHQNLTLTAFSGDTQLSTVQFYA